MSELVDIVDEIIKEELDTIKEVIKEELDPLTKFGSPEKLLGIPYEQWKGNPNILMALSRVYGTGPDSILEKFIADKDISKMYESEKGL
jgi:hypothetical protein